LIEHPQPPLRHHDKKKAMPFCTNCGKQVDQSASFCANCGTAQPRAAGQAQDLLHGISERTASILCYIPIFGVIPSIVFLASQKFRYNQRVRFNAFQSVYLFVAWLIVSSVGPHRSFASLLEALLTICWIYLLIKASHSEQVHLPILGDLAARSTSEQL
jgi:uncharacterized membrane protein